MDRHRPSRGRLQARKPDGVTTEFLTHPIPPSCNLLPVAVSPCDFSAFLVEDRGFEPLTSCMPWKRANPRFAANTSGFRHLRHRIFYRNPRNRQGFQGFCCNFCCKSRAWAASRPSQWMASPPPSVYSSFISSARLRCDECRTVSTWTESPRVANSTRLDGDAVGHFRALDPLKSFSSASKTSSISRPSPRSAELRLSLTAWTVSSRSAGSKSRW